MTAWLSGSGVANGPGLGLAVVAVLTSAGLLMLVWWSIPQAPLQAPPLTSVSAPHAAAVAAQQQRRGAFA